MMNVHGSALVGFYDYRMVSISVLIAFVLAYAALDLAGRVTMARGLARFIWLSGGAVAFGLGIWSKSFVGMVAFHLPVPVKKDGCIVWVLNGATLSTPDRGSGAKVLSRSLRRALNLFVQECR